MKKMPPIAALAFAIVAFVVLSGCSSATPAATPSTSGSGSASSAGTAVNIANFAFSPADLTVKVGDTVMWTNNDTVTHTVTGAAFDLGQMAPGATGSHKFEKAGSYDYHCSIHPSMTGKVTVQ